MSDVTAQPPPVPAPMNWADVADTLLHYLAGGAILTIAFGGVYIGKLSSDVFTPLLFGAAAAVGFKMSK